jgi:hypothetical protein
MTVGLVKKKHNIMDTFFERAQLIGISAVLALVENAENRRI